MAAQIIELPIDIVDILRASNGEIAMRLGETTNLYWDIEAARYDSPTFIARGYPDVHGLGHRTLTLDGVLVLALIPCGGSPACWPRPLPDAVTLRMIDLVEPVLSEIDTFTGHQQLALAAAFEQARQMPAIGLRSVVPLPPRSARQRRWRRVALELSTAFAKPLQALDRKLSSYKARLMESDLEAVVVSLSSWTDPGVRLYLRPRNNDMTAPCVALLAETRRGDLRAAMECANVLADTTIGMLERHDPHAVPFMPCIRFDDLMLINGYIVNSPFDNLRSRSLRIEPCGTAQVRPAGVRRALNQWCHDIQPGFWTGIHPLVHAAMGYLELLRIRPFISANGRVARIILQLLLHRAGWPVLPWEAAFEILANEDRSVFRSICCKDSFTAFSRAVLRWANLAVDLGIDMLETLVPMREELVDGFSAESRADGSARRFAADLLRGPLVVGISSCSRERKRRELGALLDAGKINRVWSPFGATYSVPEIRKLLRELPISVR